MSTLSTETLLCAEVQSGAALSDQLIWCSQLFFFFFPITGSQDHRIRNSVTSKKDTGQVGIFWKGGFFFSIMAHSKRIE